MSILPAEGNPNEFSQQVMNSVAENSHMPVPCVESEACSVTPSENSSFNLESFLSLTSSNTQLLCKSVFFVDDLLDDEQPFNHEPEFIEYPGSMAQNEDMYPRWDSSATIMSSLGEEEGNPNELPQQLSSHDNSQRDVGEEGVGCFEPNPSHLDNADQASNERIQKGRKPRLTPTGKVEKQLDQAGTSAEPCINSRQKRKSRETIILREEQEDERKMRKREKDRKYRADKKSELNELKSELNELRIIKPQYERLIKIASSFGGIDEMESQINHMNLMRCKYPEIENMESMLDKFKDMEAEINRLKKIELQHKQMENQMELESFPFNASPGSLGEQRGSQSLDLIGDSHMASDQYGISLNSSAAMSGITPDMQYSDVLVRELIAKLTDKNVKSELDDTSFKDYLDGERESVGEYRFPQSLVSTARDIFNAHGDITTKCRHSPYLVQDIFDSCCAAIKEMGDRLLEEVTEKNIRKWRDAIMDAKCSKFNVEFAMEHLKTIVKAYFGLKALKDRESFKRRMASLRAYEEALRKELEKKLNEINAVEAKQEDLTSELCKICQEAADKFLGKTVGIF